MPREFHRSMRVQALLQRQLADIIRSEVKDPRVGMVTVVDVRVSRDLEHARIFISDLDIDAAQASVVALNAAAGFIRHQLKKRLSMRIIPELQFRYDASLEQGSRLYSLIEETTKEDRTRSSDPDPESESE